jgi:hypothetical protein
VLISAYLYRFFNEGLTPNLIVSEIMILQSNIITGIINLFDLIKVRNLFCIVQEITKFKVQLVMSAEINLKRSR